jgi:hypothetical protein
LREDDTDNSLLKEADCQPANFAFPVGAPSYNRSIEKWCKVTKINAVPNDIQLALVWVPLEALAEKTTSSNSAFSPGRPFRFIVGYNLYIQNARRSMRRSFY